MAGPFYNCIKGTTSGTPGTGAFTPNAASSGFLAWSTVPTGWIGLVRFEDGTDWELQYCYWNGTTLSRSATAQFVASSTGSGLTLTSAATAAMVADANEIGPDFSTLPARGIVALAGSSGSTAIGCAAATVTGTGASSGFSTNFLLRQPRVKSTSATTANAQAGWSHATALQFTSSTSGAGGWQFTARFGASTLPTGPRVFIGMTGTTYVASTAEPSALTAHFAILGKDSTDTNLQIMTNSNAGSATKIDTGIALATSAFYELTLWSNPGSLTIYYLLVRLDSGAIFYGSTATDIPAADIGIFPQLLMCLNGTNTGTAVVVELGHYLMRQAG